MIVFPKFLFFFLFRIPLIGGAFKRSPDEIDETETTIKFPVLWLIDAVFRFLLCLAVVGVVVYMLMQNLPETPPEHASVELEQAIFLSDEEFNELLDHYDRDELIQLLQLSVQDRDVSDPLHRQGLTNQILAANKLGKSPMRSRRVFGITRELELRTALALADLENHRFEPEQNGQLRELATLYEGVEFPDQDQDTDILKERAGIGQVISSFISSVETPAEESAAEMEGFAMEKLQQLGQRSVISKESRDLLLRVLHLARKRLQHVGKTAEPCDVLEQTLREVNRVNRQRAIDEFSQIDCSLASASELDYLALEEPIRKDRFLRDFESKLQQLIQCGDLAADEFSIMLTKIEGLVRGGWIHASRRLLTDVVDLMKNQGEFPQLEQRASRIRLLQDKIGRTFDETSMKTVENRHAWLERDQALATFVVFISIAEEDRLLESNAKIVEMARVYNTLADSKQIRFYGVVVHQDQEARAIKVAKGLTERLKPIEFWHLDTESSAGREFLEAVPLDKLPHVLILDKLNRVVALDPRPTQTIEIVGKLNLMDR